MKSFISALAVVGILVAMAGASPAAAATPDGGSPRLVGVATSPMSVQREVSAIRHGRNTTVILDNGVRFTMPTAQYQAAQRRLDQAGPRTNNTVFGNCGYSYTYLYDWGALTYRLAVGFHVDSPAVSSTWSAYVNGAGRTYYEYHYTAGGSLAWRSDWAGGHTGKVPAADNYEGETVFGAAQLWYGTWCFSGYPTDVTWVN